MLRSVFWATLALLIGLPVHSEPRTDMINFATYLMPYFSLGQPNGGSTATSQLRCKLQIARLRMTVIDHVYPVLKGIPPSRFGVVSQQIQQFNNDLDGFATQPPDQGCDVAVRDLAAGIFTVAVEEMPADGWIAVATVRLLAEREGYGIARPSRYQPNGALFMPIGSATIPTVREAEQFIDDIFHMMDQGVSSDARDRCTALVRSALQAIGQFVDAPLERVRRPPPIDAEQQLRAARSRLTALGRAAPSTGCDTTVKALLAEIVTIAAHIDQPALRTGVIQWRQAASSQTNGAGPTTTSRGPVNSRTAKLLERANHLSSALPRPGVKIYWIGSPNTNEMTSLRLCFDGVVWEAVDKPFSTHLGFAREGVFDTDNRSVDIATLEYRRKLEEKQRLQIAELISKWLVIPNSDVFFAPYRAGVRHAAISDAARATREGCGLYVSSSPPSVSSDRQARALVVADGLEIDALTRISSDVVAASQVELGDQKRLRAQALAPRLEAANRLEQDCNRETSCRATADVALMACAVGVKHAMTTAQLDRNQEQLMIQLWNYGVTGGPGSAGNALAIDQDSAIVKRLMGAEIAELETELARARSVALRHRSTQEIQSIVERMRVQGETSGRCWWAVYDPSGPAAGALRR